MNNQLKNTAIPERPKGLGFLCILSFIGSGLSFVSHLATALFYESFLQILESGIYDNIQGLNMTEVKNYLLEGGKLFFFLSALCFAFSLFGVYKMWHLQKVGIHFYAIAQLCLVILPLLLISKQIPVLSSLLMALLFIFLYASYRKSMR